MLDEKGMQAWPAVASSDASHHAELEQAIDCLRSAIALLDAADAPPQIAAHIDLALNQLQTHHASTR